MSQLLEMRRPGREGEKAYHFHHWAYVNETPDWITFECVRCGDLQRIYLIKTILPDWFP